MVSESVGPEDSVAPLKEPAFARARGAIAGKLWAVLGRAQPLAGSTVNSSTALLEKPSRIITNFIDDRTERITRRLKALTEQLLQVAFFFASAVSCYFIGLFSNIGLEYFSVVDKQSMLGSIFLLTALFSSLRVVIGVLPTLLSEERTDDTERSQQKTITANRALSASILTWLVAGGGLAYILIGLFHTLVLVAIGTALYFTFRHRSWRARLLAGLVMGLSFGFLRAEYLREAPPEMAIKIPQTGAVEEAMLPVNVIMSADRGLLVVVASNRSIRFVPWEQILSVDPYEQASVGWSVGPRSALASLRQWINAIWPQVQPSTP